jgi:hypothetical protein
VVIFAALVAAAANVMVGNIDAASHGARIQTSRSSSVVKITGIGLGWIGSTTAFGAVVRKPYT